MRSAHKRTLADLHRGESARLLPLSISGVLAETVMEAGFLPGTTVTMLHSAPGGGPKIYRLDGAEIAIRRDLAASLGIEALPPGETA
jgi:ferrous iron transport protein A